ncbi:hypothetical protein HY491_01325 [Candidatus Woesearchaeota archaeon]|nr:hypothetical protein [Candidatus Woesearchaeota archaeon]
METYAALVLAFLIMCLAGVVTELVKERMAGRWYSIILQVVIFGMFIYLAMIVVMVVWPRDLPPMPLNDEHAMPSPYTFVLVGIIIATASGKWITRQIRKRARQRQLGASR